MPKCNQHGICAPLKCWLALHPSWIHLSTLCSHRSCLLPLLRVGKILRSLLWGRRWLGGVVYFVFGWFAICCRSEYFSNLASHWPSVTVRLKGTSKRQSCSMHCADSTRQSATTSALLYLWLASGLAMPRTSERGVSLQSYLSYTKSLYD